MPAPERQDIRLNSLLSDLAQRAAGGDGAALVRRNELPGEDLDALLNAGLLEPCGPARETLCEGCERGCVMPVEFRRSPDADRVDAFIACDKREDIGRVSVDPAALDRWRLTLAQLAAILGKALGTDQEPRPSRSGDAWLLGAFTRGKGFVDVVLRTDGGVASPNAGLIVTLAEPAADAPAIALARLLRFRHGALSVDRGALARARSALR